LLQTSSVENACSLGMSTFAFPADDSESNQWTC
jgi:hypothetical protein